MKKRNIHNKTIDEIVDRLKNSNIKYDKISKNVEYKRKKSHNDLAGEIDVLAYKIYKGKNHLLLFEIKTSENKKNKAYQQLYRAEKFIGMNYDKVFKIYISPRKLEWVK